MRFGFGKNWENFVENCFSEERLQTAQDHLLSFLGLDSLDGKVFLDIGSGSGIHSYAALKAGAKKVISFDYDVDSVNTTKAVWERAGNPENWEVREGSVLDREFLGHLERADVIYSWGVLHHTGEMWDAIANTCRLAGDNTLIYLALYTDEFMSDSGDFWLDIKQKYNCGSWLSKRKMECWYTWKYTWPGSSVLQKIAGAPKQLGHIWGYSRSRGMDFYTDVKDWLGGWPMEFAGTGDVIEFCGREFGFELINLSTGEANSEYLFAKGSVDSRHSFNVEKILLEDCFTAEGGFAWSADVAAYEDSADSIGDPKRSPLILFEDDDVCLFAHSTHDRIRTTGKGSYSHWGRRLFFSATDNSNPNDNGKKYRIGVKS